ncbi:MAG: peptide deformylase [Candidatus Neomarinimicrobiota bacterium]
MAARDVTLYGRSILKRKCRAVEDFSVLEPLISDMFDTMYEEEGVGLAANQIGLDLNLMVVDVSHTEEADEAMVFINGEIIDSTGEAILEEGCLSLPEVRVDVKRPETITLKYQSIDGQEHVATYSGLLARVIQHESDHLNGIVIIDRVSPLVRMKFSQELKQIAQRAREQSQAL